VLGWSISPFYPTETSLGAVAELDTFHPAQSPASWAKRRVDPDQHDSNESMLAREPFTRRRNTFHQKEEQMKPLSEQLAELSARAKGAEDAFEGAEKEARDKVEARKAEALSAAKTAVEKVNQQIKSAGDSATKDTKALQAKITADVNALKAHVVEAKHGLDVKLAEQNAELLESDAGFAIDYAIASVEQARLAVLDAIDGRLAAEQAKRS
jgi:signal transduction protein with GAF and PtsI domain